MSAAVGIYVRISQDRTGAALGVARQEEDCRKLADARGWSVREVYVDNDVSAYSGKPRPAWQRLLRDVRSGVIDTVIGWHVDRLTRSPRELEDIIQLADQHGLQLATVSGEVDLSTAAGRMVARILGSTARLEAEHKSERQRRQRRQAAEAGRVAGGGTRPFGYAMDRVSLVETEAELIREAAGRVLAGESLSSVCRDFASRRVRTPAGGAWQPRTLRRMLASARISGRREHIPVNSHGGTRPLCGEITAIAEWPPIITIEQSDRLRVRATSSSTDDHVPRGRKYLLSGLMRCGRCGTGMVGRPRSGVPRYVCPNVPGTDSCGGVATIAATTDALMRDLVLTALDSPELTRHMSDGEDFDELASLSDAERRKDELAAMWAAGELSTSEWHAGRAVLEKRIAAARSRLFAHEREAARRQVSLSTDLQKSWEEMSLDQRRQLLASVVERIVCAPANPRKKWDPDRFRLIWRA